MAGGLINIVSYVSNDLYLTGAPQISFYKMVYRRYTNFAKDSIHIKFENAIKFGQESELIPPRIGDLIKDSVLHINIPSISITNQDVGIDTSDIQFSYLDNSKVTDYESIINVYMVVLIQIYRIVSKAVFATNVTLTGLIQDVQTYVNTGSNLSILSQYDALILKTYQELISISDPRASLFNSNLSNLWKIITNIDVNNLITTSANMIDTTIYAIDSAEYIQELQKLMKNSVKKQIDVGLDFCKKIQKYYFTTYQNFISTTKTDKNKNIKCAWVKNLGHSLIEYIDIHIGGKRIDRHWGIWINIWYQLTYKEAQKQIYDEMIGNIPKLTNFDNEEKPSYDLYIPMTFWFNKFNGLSFPLIAMQYHDIRFTLKLRKLEEVFFIERLYKADLNGSEVVLTANLIDFITNRSQYTSTLTNIEIVNDIVLSDIWDSKGKNLDGDMLIDYIYLESPERKRFAQSGHEYLIERMQHAVFKNINQTDFNVQLDFTNPSKEIIWLFNKDIYTQNNQSWNECRWHDFATTNGKGNPILTSYLTFNGYNRIQKQAGIYFNILQPLTYHMVSPNDGINMYSFCLEPKQHQPTGACNFTKLSDIRLYMAIDDMFYRYIDADIYPYDSNIDFTFTITDPAALLDNIDILYVRKIINDYNLSISNKNVPTSVFLQRLQDANSTLYVYNQLANGSTVQINMSAYKRLIQKTTGTCHIFDLTLNILRLIGGYGALAYSGNS